VRGNNALALGLVCAAAGLLTVAMVSPIITYNAIGVETNYSLFGGIWLLFKTRQWFIAVVLLLFSVVFPYLKLIITAVAAQRGGWDNTLHGWVYKLGPLSLLDVFVLAVVVTLIQMRDLLKAEPRYGIVLFCVAILLSMVAAHYVVRTKQPRSNDEVAHMAEDASEQTSVNGVVAMPTGFAWVMAVLFAIAAVGLGGGAWWVGETAPIAAVRVEQQPGLKMPDITVTSLLGEARDMTVVVATPAGDVGSETIRGKVVGGGLDFKLVRPVKRENVREIGLFDPRDEGVMSRTVGFFRGAKPLDRVDHVDAVTDGAVYRFTLVAGLEVARQRFIMRVAAWSCLVVALLIPALGALTATRRSRRRTLEGA
jgi:hypothetical protein